ENANGDLCGVTAKAPAVLVNPAISVAAAKFNLGNQYLCINEKTTMESSATVAFDRSVQLKAFDETKIGVKGLVDAGISEIPAIFRAPPATITTQNHLLRRSSPSQQSISKEARTRSRGGIWVREFHEQDPEVRKGFYSRDPSIATSICIAHRLLTGGIHSVVIRPQILLHQKTCQPFVDLTLGLTKHSDNSFLTVLLQDQVGGLQVLHDQYWVDVPPVPGALVVNVGDLLQLITNGKFISVEHRVLANKAGPRISVGCFFSSYLMANPRVYGPIKELLSEENHPYIETPPLQSIQSSTDPKVSMIVLFFQHKELYGDDQDWFIRSFRETKTGVKGLVDAGITQLPRIFHDSPSNLSNPKPPSSDLLHLTTIPTIDLEGRVFEDETKRKNTVDGIRDAAEKWGFFQVINHGVSLDLLERMKDGVRRFNEQAPEVEETQAMSLGEFLFELISEALGLNRNHLKEIDCSKGLRMLCHYYPPCPEPDLTLGTTKHSDIAFLTVLLPDQIEGLQVLREVYWFDVPHVPGALIINVGDLLQATRNKVVLVGLMQLVTNDKFISSEHRVLANRATKARVSVACFFTTGIRPNPRIYGPIRELCDMDCTNSLLLLGHYYPPCPKPDLTLGLTKYSDNSFLTVLLQDQVGGLQVLHDQYWIDVPHVPGALVVNRHHHYRVFKFYRSKGFDANTMETTKIAALDRISELKAFDETKTGVKGLVDAGIITQLPRIFHDSPSNLANPKSPSSDLLHLATIPTIDLEGRVFEDETKRKNMDGVKDAAEKWGFFQVVNHGVSLDLLERMKDGVRRFNEQAPEVKKQYYSRDFRREFVYTSNFDLYSSSAASWRDTFSCYLAPNPPKPQDLPEICRDVMLEYSKQAMSLGEFLFELLSEALGLNPNHLRRLIAPRACACSAITTHHFFLTVLLPDQIEGLQVLREGYWFDVPPLITNDKFISSEHRVLANRATKARVSVACFFTTGIRPNPRIYGPIRELVSKDNPPKYREITVMEFAAHRAVPKDLTEPLICSI
ncbi:hypothetical protein HID58_069194, partial [Brassica napus]